MALVHGHFVAKNVGGGELVRLLGFGDRHAPDSAVGERFRLAEEGPWSAALLQENPGHVARWAQLVSYHGDVLTVSFLVLEHTWNYAVFMSGRCVAGMQFFPFEEPVIYGNVAEAARLLACEQHVFDKYHTAIVSVCRGEVGEDEYAYLGDEFAAADEYGYLDFAKRIGVPGDPFFEPELVNVTIDCHGRSDWQGLPAVPSELR